MSCYLSSADALNALATYWEASANRGMRSAESFLTRALFLAERAESGRDDFAAATDAAALMIRQECGSAWSAVFSLLLNANLQSVNDRYPGDSEMSETGPEYFNAEPLSIVKYWIQTKETGKIVGILNSYEYQACDANDWESSAAYQLCKQIKNFLLDDMLKSAGDDVNLSASFEAPEDPRETHMNRVLADINSRAVK